MTKHYHLAPGLVLPFIIGLGSCAKSGTKAPEHPNILFIMTDQQSASMMSCTGNKWLKTPALDAIAADGVRFSRAYATNPVCVPSRFSLQTGRYPSEIGMRENSRFTVPKDQVTGFYTNGLGNVFRNAGYQTYYGGKVHMPATGSNVGILGYELLTKDERDSLASVCADFLLNRKKSDKPFLLFASFINPHDICYHAIRWATPESNLAKRTPWELDEALKLPEGVSEEEFFNEYCPPLPDNHQPMIGELSSVDSLIRLRSFRGIVRDKWTDKDWRMHRWAYMRLTERVDGQIGIVMDALKKSGLAKNTVVIFTADHGDHDASHKLEHKTVLYEEATNIPFIVSYPWMKNKGMVDNEHLVSNGLSLLPTLCDLAGIEPPPDLEGKSVLPLIQQENDTDWPKYIYLESETGFMIHTGRFKYEIDNTGIKREMLVDLQTDPGEKINMIDNPEYKSTIDSLRNKLFTRLESKGIQIGLPVGVK